MSQVVRQSKLFAAEDFTKVYKSFQNIDFTAYDFDTIRNALVQYIRVQFPEDFNDYIESSEFIAIIELLAYLGTSLAFRVDLNSRENIMDTAERRESIIRLARLINYQPKRNIAASGLFKVNSLSTTQPLTDSVGNSIANVNVFWGDPNNPDWFDQFVTILNASLQTTNPFGRPSKSGTVGNIPTDLYALNNVLRLNVTQPITISVNGEQLAFDVCNPNFEDQGAFFERQPDPTESFNLIYRNDGQGVSSNNTGFFLFFKQGKLESNDFRYDFPEPSRLQPLPKTNVNQTDVYVQEIDQNGTVLQKWTKVPSVNGTNVIYNSIAFQERNIYEVISEVSDKVTIKFPDGNFGNVPTNIMRFWTRSSIGRNVIIRPEDAQSIQITMPYVGVDNQRYSLTITFSLEYTVANGSSAESNEQIKDRAPQTFYTQERMINNEDYNVFPLLYGSEIVKLKSVNRTYSGNSRYINVNDPTGFHQDLVIIGEDGAIFNENEEQREVREIDKNVIGLLSDVVLEELQNFMLNQRLRNFFYNNYMASFAEQFSYVPPEGSADAPIPFTYFDFTTETYWKTAPDKFKNDTGFLIKDLDTTIPNWPYGPASGSNYSNIFSTVGVPYKFVVPGAILTLSVENSSGEEINTVSSSVTSVSNNGMAYDTAITLVGPIELGSEVNDLLPAKNIIPNFRSMFNANDPMQDIIDRINATGSFGLGYDVINDLWYVLDVYDTANEFGLQRIGIPDNPTTNDQLSTTYAPSWLVTVNVTKNSYEFVSRGTATIFQSLRQIRFYWDPEYKVYDSKTGESLYDQIIVLADINNSSEVETCVCDGTTVTRPVPLKNSIIWNPVGMFTQDDGFRDPSKIEIMPADLNGDGLPDYPMSFFMLANPKAEVVIETYTDFDGYEKTRPWVSAWNTTLLNMTNTDQLTLVIPTAGSTIGTTATANEIGFRITEGTSNTFVPLSSADLFMSMYVPTGGGKTVPERIAELLTTSINDPATFENAKRFVTIMQDGKTVRNGVVGTNISDQNYYNFRVVRTDVETYVETVVDNKYFGYPGISLEQNSLVPPNEVKGLTIKWKHYAPADQRIDPSASNIIDMVVLTDAYYRDVLLWKNENKPASEFPKAPTTEELRIQFGELNEFKSISDALVFNSGSFRVLFGRNAIPELQATFKAIKLPSSTISDNELKTRIVQAIDVFFEIRNWDFGEKFYYTELAAYIHSTLSQSLSSVVIVPKKEEAQFGDLFEIVAGSTELFLSTATVADVELVTNYTETNLRV
jgi:hypothetical protein